MKQACWDENVVSLFIFPYDNIYALVFMYRALYYGKIETQTYYNIYIYIYIYYIYISLPIHFVSFLHLFNIKFILSKVLVRHFVSI